MYHGHMSQDSCLDLVSVIVNSYGAHMSSCILVASNMTHKLGAKLKGSCFLGIGPPNEGRFCLGHYQGTIRAEKLSETDPEVITKLVHRRR